MYVEVAIGKREHKGESLNNSTGYVTLESRTTGTKQRRGYTYIYEENFKRNQKNCNKRNLFSTCLSK